MLPYVNDLRNVIDMDVIRAASLKLGVDPLGGAAAPYWAAINDTYHLILAVVNPTIDPTFSIMTVDHDGKIRMDCSSPYAMARLLKLSKPVPGCLRQRPGRRPAWDCHPAAALINPNHFLSVAIRYLLTNRPPWPARPRLARRSSAAA